MGGILSKRRRLHPARDPFGEVVITWSYVAAWTLAVAGIPVESWRWGYYVKGWNVADKVRQAKLAGTFDAIVAEPRRDRLGAIFGAAYALPPGMTLKRVRSGSR